MKKSDREPAPKKPRIGTPSPLLTFKVQNEKLRDRITALQQLVSLFGKVDTTFILFEAIEYIKFLHEQVGVLEEGGVTLEKIHTSVNPTDMLTKVFPKEKFKFCATSLDLTMA
ncbi:transcription factor bHLH112-like [Magnolia sinica]|uniref:transcription factor bHLH112-like n=1 Tax=Magnolia sinica TaxID=86752 RepID=UPI002658BACF|nr:transcription factor bHLH112-like [Magnolia sinica]